MEKIILFLNMLFSSNIPRSSFKIHNEGQLIYILWVVEQ